MPDPTRALAAEKAEKEKQAARGWAGCLGFVSMILVIAFFTYEGGDGGTRAPGVANAQIICENRVAERLRAPSTADFPLNPQMGQSIGNQTFLISSYVDSQNGFGAMVRANWTCRIRFDGGDWSYDSNWTLLNLDIE